MGESQYLGYVSPEAGLCKKMKKRSGRRTTSAPRMPRTRTAELKATPRALAGDLEAVERQLQSSQARVSELEKKLASSRYLFKAVWRKILHAPREWSQKFRRRLRSNVGWSKVGQVEHFQPLDRYVAWAGRNRWNKRATDALRAALAARKGRLPRFSVIMPVFNTPSSLLEEAIGNVRSQIYKDWELCIADDGSTDPAIGQTLTKLAARDPRIRWVRRSENGGISAATNSAAELATGEFLAFLDHDDLLTPDALGQMALYAADHSDTDIIYSDDDKIDMAGRRYDPQFKPDWSPTLLLSYMYVSHLLVVRRSLFAAVGGVREGFEGSQDYDLALRASERARSIGHVPRVLYHWRAAPGSVAKSAATKPRSIDAGLRAVVDALVRRKIDAAVVQPDWAKVGKLGIYAAAFPDDGPRVAILIPHRDRTALLQRCLESLRKTTYRNYEIVILDDENDDPAALDFMAGSGHRVLRIERQGGSFSFARINNRAVHQVDAEYVLFLNDDTEAINPRWLSQMMGHARMPGVGAVGAKLVYGDNRIQHAGVALHYPGGLPGHAFRNVPAGQWGYLSYLNVAREYSAVTAACMLTPRALFLECGGFDEAAFPVAYNDVDYCFKLGDRGYRCVFCADATLVHHEGQSRPRGDRPSEVAEIRRRQRGRNDPYYNPNLSGENELFEIQPHCHPIESHTPVRVLAVSHNLNHEGASNVQLEVLTGLKRRGALNPIVFSLQNGPLRSAYEAAGIEVRLIDPPTTSSPAEFDRSITNIASAIRRSRAEVMYANTLQTFWAVEAARKAGVPAILNIHESEPWESYFDFLPRPLRPIAYRCFLHPYRVIFVSEASRRVWAPFDSQHNFAVIKNGLNMDRLRRRAASISRKSARAQLKIKPDDIVVVLLGTVCERKGQLDLVRAFRRLPRRSARRLRLFIVGDRPGPYSDQLHAEAGALDRGLRARLTIVSETGKPYRYLQAADIALCCSRVESYPRVTLEAMAFGLPLITTPVFGIAEQVRDGINALFYGPGDIAQLASRIEELLASPSMRAMLASNARPVLESLPNFEDMLDEYGRAFREASVGS